MHRIVIIVIAQFENITHNSVYYDDRLLHSYNTVQKKSVVAMCIMATGSLRAEKNVSFFFSSDLKPGTRSRTNHEACSISSEKKQKSKKSKRASFLFCSDVF